MPVFTGYCILHCCSCKALVNPMLCLIKVSCTADQHKRFNRAVKFTGPNEIVYKIWKCLPALYPSGTALSEKLCLEREVLYWTQALQCENSFFFLFETYGENSFSIIFANGIFPLYPI